MSEYRAEILDAGYLPQEVDDALAWADLNPGLWDNDCQRHQIALSKILYGSKEIADGAIVAWADPDAWTSDTFGIRAQQMEAELIPAWSRH